MTPSAILFDLDDTILTCEGGDHRKLWRTVIDSHAHRFDGISAEQLYLQLRKIADAYWSDSDRHREGRKDMLATRIKLVQQAVRSLNLSNDEAATRLAVDYHDRRENSVIPFDGAIETLVFLRTLPIRTALLTNGAAQLQRSKIDRYQLSQYFDAVLVEGEVGVGKPEPAIYTQAMDRLGVSSKETWIVGDNLEWEVSVPQSLGLTAIWHDFRREGLPEDCRIKPDHIVGRISELRQLIDAVR